MFAGRKKRSYCARTASESKVARMAGLPRVPASLTRSLSNMP